MAKNDKDIEQKNDVNDCVIKVGGVEYELILTTKAMKEIFLKYGGVEKLGFFLENNENPGQSYLELIWVTALLANQSVLIHNLKNPQEKRELLTEETIELLTLPYEFGGFKNMILSAIIKGMKRDVESEDDEKNSQGG